MKIFNNIVFQSVFKIYYSSLLNFLRRDHNNVRMRHLVYILYIRDGQGHGRGRGWTWRACVQTEFDGWTLSGAGVVIYTKRKAQYIPTRVSHFARYTAGLYDRLRFFIFNRREKKLHTKSEIMYTYLLHSTAAVFEGRSHYYYETWRSYKFRYIYVQPSLSPTTIYVYIYIVDLIIYPAAYYSVYSA